jgi:hypothetical protein
MGAERVVGGFGEWTCTRGMDGARRGNDVSESSQGEERGRERGHGEELGV